MALEIKVSGAARPRPPIWMFRDLRSYYLRAPAAWWTEIGLRVVNLQVVAGSDIHVIARFCAN